MNNYSQLLYVGIGPLTPSGRQFNGQLEIDKVVIQVPIIP